MRKLDSSSRTATTSGTTTLVRTSAFVVGLVPAVALAHPGHAEANVPALHAWSHALPALAAMAVIGFAGAYLWTRVAAPAIAKRRDRN